MRNCNDVYVSTDHRPLSECLWGPGMACLSFLEYHCASGEQVMGVAHYVYASDLREGHVIITGNHRRERVCDVRSLRDGRVHVDLNEWTGVHIYHDFEPVQVVGKEGEE